MLAVNANGEWQIMQQTKVSSRPEQLPFNCKKLAQGATPALQL